MYRANKNISNYIKIVIRVLQYFFVLLFVYAAVSKLLDFETFRVQLAQSPLLSAYAGILAWAVPVAELVIAVLLCFEPTKKLGVSGFFFMMVMFSAYIFFILKFADFVPCSCGGVLEKMSWGQHLVFNLVFVALSGIILYFGMGGKRRRRWVVLGTQFILGTSVVGVLFAFSERKMQRNNAFQRRYVRDAISYKGDYALQSNNYYIAGLRDSTIYLGNYQAPLYLKTLLISIDSIKDFPVQISNVDLPYRRAHMVVEPPYFYLGDGTVPVIFRGNIKDWKASIFSSEKVNFKEFVISDSTTIGLATISNTTGSTTLGILSKTTLKDSFFYNDRIITKQFDGIFDTDGKLLWNDYHKRWLYIYYYRNNYEVAGKNLQLEFNGKTIDTISRAFLDIVHHRQRDQYKKGGKSIVVNRNAATYGDYLYVNSDRIGRNENKKILESAAIIDVYNIINHTYEFSFHITHQPNKKLNDFRVERDILIAIVNKRLWIYKLEPKYFGYGSIATHTGRYQAKTDTCEKK